MASRFARVTTHKKLVVMAEGYRRFSVESSASKILLRQIFISAINLIDLPVKHFNCEMDVLLKCQPGPT